MKFLLLQTRKPIDLPIFCPEEIVGPCGNAPVPCTNDPVVPCVVKSPCLKKLLPVPAEP